MVCLVRPVRAVSSAAAQVPPPPGTLTVWVGSLVRPPAVLDPVVVRSVSPIAAVIWSLAERAFTTS